MKTFKIELIKIGRDKFSEVIDMKFINRQQACQYAVNETSKHLMSSDIEMSGDDKDEVFTVFAGFRNVGTVKVTQEKKK